MRRSDFLFCWCVTAAVFLPMDAAWLLAAGPSLYKPALGALMREDLALVPIVLLYAIYFVGVVVLAVRPASQEQDGGLKAAARGAMLGLTVYGVYDLTNLATLVPWSWKITLFDIAWGTTVTTVASYLTAVSYRAYLARRA